MAGRIRTILEMIKFEHSVFALPFALTGALLAARATAHGWPTLRQILWIVVAMVAARSAAMTLNRIADLRYDKENPRTKMRALATGALSVGFAWTFTLIAVAVFLLAAPVPGLRTRYFARRGVDCHHRWARLAHIDSLRCGDALGRRLRCALCLPGRGIRSRRGLVFGAETFRHRQRAA